MASDFDGLLTHLGTGRWQALFCTVAVYRGLLGALNGGLTGAFIAPQVEYTCRPPEGALTNYSDKCTYQMLNPDLGSIETHLCEAWDFDNSTWTSTINSEFNLACGSTYLASSWMGLQGIGWGFGSAFNSLLCDEFGRKKMFIVGVCIYLTCTLVPLLHSIGLILVIRFLIGFGGACMFDAISTLTMETSEPRVRAAMSMAVWIPWVLGTMILGGLGFLFRDWRTLQMVTSLPFLLMIPTYWLLDESPRWLIVKGRRIKALKILKKAATWQKVTLPSDEELDIIMDKCRSQSNKGDESTDSKLDKIRKFFQRYFLLFRTPRLRTVTLVAYFNMIVLDLVLFGVALGGVQYSDDPFIYMTVSGLVELPSVTIVPFILSRWGRKIPGMFFFFSCGVSLLVLSFIPKDMMWLSMTLALLAKSLCSMAWAAFYLHATELFPTEVRVLGMGTCGVMNSIGATMSPYVNDLLSPVVPWAPSVIFGSAAILSTFATALVPETSGVSMPDTIEEMEARDYSIIKRNPDSTITAATMT